MRRMRERDDENRHNTSFPKLLNGESAPLSPERGHVSRYSHTDPLFHISTHIT